MTQVLEVKDVSIRFGGLKALDGVDIDVGEWEIVGLIGPNGAGKTTAFNVITRLYTPDEGDVRFEGQSLLGTSPSGVIRRGIARTFQNVELFRGMSVIDNVRVGTHARRGEQSPEDVLFYVNLHSLRYRSASELPYGTQKRVELARALCAEPGLVLLDEPVAGMTREESAAMAAAIASARGELGISALVVEHDMAFVRDLGVKVTVLHEGSVLAEGSLDAVSANERVVEVYLGR